MLLHDGIDLESEAVPIECHARLNREDDKGWLKTVDGFANGKGGVFYLGVEDKTHRLIGYDLQERDREKRYFRQMLDKHFKTAIGCKMDVIPYEVQRKKRYLLKIRIFESSYKPVFLYIGNDAFVYLRNGRETIPATSENIYFMAKRRACPAFDVQQADIPFHKEDFTKLYAFYKELNEDKELTEKELESIGFYDKEYHLKRGALLFQDKCLEDNTLIHCTTFRSDGRGADRIIDSRDFKGNLIDSFHFLYEYIDKGMNHGFLKTALSRKDCPSFPSRALMENLINALVHRDYTMDGSAISIDMFKNRLMITSPGSLFGKSEIGPTYNLDSLYPARRNKMISDVFVLCGAMEKSRTGFEKIMKEYENADDSHKPFVFSKNNRFTIVLPDLTNEEGVDISEESLCILIEKQYRLNEKYSKKVLAFCYGKQRSLREITSRLDLSYSTYFKQEVLNPLIENELLTTAKVRNATVYKTNSDKVSLT